MTKQVILIFLLITQISLRPVEFTSKIDDTYPNEVVSIAGEIRTNWGDAIEEVNVEISGNTSDSIITEETGEYVFQNLPDSSDYSIIPSKDINVHNGLSGFDMVMIHRHILGINLLDSPYQLIAADVNNSGDITMFDLVHIRRLILFIIEEYPNNTSWRFIPADYVFPDPTNPWLEDFPEQIDYTALDSSLMNQDYIGIKIGDVNGSANPGN